MMHYLHFEVSNLSHKCTPLFSKTITKFFILTKKSFEVSIFFNPIFHAIFSVEGCGCGQIYYYSRKFNRRESREKYLFLRNIRISVMASTNLLMLAFSPAKIIFSEKKKFKSSLIQSSCRWAVFKISNFTLEI